MPFPAFNAERFIEESVRSALGQTHPAVEVIVVDDGSTDRTREVLAGIEDERLHVIGQANSGVGRARNEGIRTARGDYIALLDADDVWAPEKLSRQVAALNEHPHWAAVGSFMYHIAADGRPLAVSGHHIGEREAREIREVLLMPFPISSLLPLATPRDEVPGGEECRRGVGHIPRLRAVRAGRGVELAQVASGHRGVLLSRRRGSDRGTQGRASCSVGRLVAWARSSTHRASPGVPTWPPG